MGYGTKITEEIEYGKAKIIVTKRITPTLQNDDYQEMLTACIDMVRDALNSGKKGDFGIKFCVDQKRNTVKRSESYYTESIERIEIAEE